MKRWKSRPRGIFFNDFYVLIVGGFSMLVYHFLLCGPKQYGLELKRQNCMVRTYIIRRFIEHTTSGIFRKYAVLFSSSNFVKNKADCKALTIFWSEILTARSTIQIFAATK